MKKRFHNNYYKLVAENYSGEREGETLCLMPVDQSEYEDVVDTIVYLKDLLDLSVAKWLTLAYHAMSGTFVDYDGGYATCPLCMLYNRGGLGGDCFGCPVYERDDIEEGHGQYCARTPYIDWSDASDNNDKFFWAKEEIRFLRGLKEKIHEPENF